MAIIRFDKNYETITILTKKQADSIAEGLSVIVVLPFLIFAFALQAVSEYVVNHMVIFSVVFFVLVFLIGFFFYLRKECKNRAFGMIAFPVGFIPFYLYIYSTFSDFATIEGTTDVLTNTISWLFFTALVVAILVFITAMAMLIKNAVWHFIISVAEVALCILLFV